MTGKGRLRIASGFKKLTSSLGKILILSAICIAMALGVAYPLWKWATTSPKSYTAAMLVIMGLLLLLLIIRTAIKKGPKNFVFFALKLAVIAGGLGGTVFFILKCYRLAALIVFLVAGIIYAILSLGDKKK